MDIFLVIGIGMLGIFLIWSSLYYCITIAKQRYKSNQLALIISNWEQIFREIQVSTTHDNVHELASEALKFRSEIERLNK